MKIGLVGEAPNDTTAIQNLLSRQYQHLEFVTLLNRINGSMLDNGKAISRLLRVEYEYQKPNIIIFIRDLDALESDRIAKKKRQDTFTYSNRIINHTGIHLLNIFEIEALILADIATFNDRYGCQIDEFEDPMLIPMPKEVLIEATRNKFTVSHNPELFSLLNFEILKQNCRYFSLFIKKFERAISASSSI
ncbi:MAG: hypothetical protein JWP37_324 [Mucilaginibacter sp.]|nr:hypothetical protein [Mucilaginibacter sp.]